MFLQYVQHEKLSFLLKATCHTKYIFYHPYNRLLYKSAFYIQLFLCVYVHKRQGLFYLPFHLMNYLIGLLPQQYHLNCLHFQNYRYPLNPHYLLCFLRSFRLRFDCRSRYCHFRHRSYSHHYRHCYYRHSYYRHYHCCYFHCYRNRYHSRNLYLIYNHAY